jgi:hypothetical protein
MAGRHGFVDITMIAIPSPVAPTLGWTILTGQRNFSFNTAHLKPPQV